MTAMRSAAQRRHSIDNLIRAGALRRKRYISIEDCARVDVPQLLAAQPPTAEETAQGFCIRIVDGVEFILKRKERWLGAWFWFLLCPSPSCRRAFAGHGVEYALRLPAAKTWACRHCLRVTWVSRRYKPRSPARAKATPLHRVQVQRARERRQHERAVRRVDQLLAPEVEQMRQKRAESVEAEAAERQRNNELALAVARSVAERGRIEVDLRPHVPVAEVIATMRRLRRFREQLGG